MSVTAHIDWLSLSWHGDFNTLFGENTEKQGKGLGAYLYSVKTEFATYQAGDKKQGNFIQMTARDIAKVRASWGMSDLEMLGVIGERKCTRIDIAVDAMDYGLTAKGLEDEYILGLIKPRSKTATLVSDTDGIRGDTFYIGSLKTRQKLFRGYEKGKQLQSWLDHFRLEVQLGSEGGSIPAYNLLRLSVDDSAVSKAMAGTVRAMLNPEKGSALYPVLTEEPIKYRVENSHVSNRRKWLDTQVLPVLKAEMDNDTEYYNYIIRRLTDTLE